MGLFFIITRSWLSDWDSKKVMPALKISLSLGLAIFLGSIYSKPNGYWEITLLKSLALEKVLAKNDISWDIELGKTPNPSLSCVEKEPEKILETYLQHCRSVADGIFCVEEGGEEVKVDKSEVVLSLSALGFCVESIGKETREIEEMVKEVVKPENPSSHVNLHEISCKICSLYK